MRVLNIETAKRSIRVSARLAKSMILLLLFAASPSALAFTITAFQPDVWPRTDAALGVNGWVIEDFEDATLVSGVTVALTNATNNFLATSSPPSGAFNPLTDDPNTAHAFAAGTWDGSAALINRYFTLSPLPAAYQDFNFGDLTFNFANGVLGVGFSVQGVELTTPILVNGQQIGRVADFLTADPATGRNGYLRIDAALGEVIYSVTLRRGSNTTRADGFVVDHLAFKAASLVEVTWKARVQAVDVLTGVSPFGTAAVGDIISGSFVYDTVGTGSPNVPPLEGTLYQGNLVSSTALVGITSFKAGGVTNAITVTNNSTAGAGDVLSFALTGGDGAIGGSPAPVGVTVTVGHTDGPGGAITTDALPARAPSLGAFGAGSAEVRLDATSGNGSGQLVATLVAIQSQPYRNSDRDGDGISNAVELQLGLNPDDPSDGAGDLDADGFSNVREVRAGSNPAGATSVPRPGYFRLSAASINVDKGDAFIPVDVQRFGGDLGAVSVEFQTQDQSAQAGVHYQAVDQTLTWADGELGPKRVDVPLIPNPGADTNRTLKLRLINPSAGTAIAIPEALVFIENDAFDPQGLPFAGFLDLDKFDVHANESSGHLETFVNRRGSASGAVSVDYSLTLPAAATGDDGSLRELVGSLVWPDGDASLKSISIPIYDDLVADPEQDIVLQLQNPTGNAYVGSNASLLIIDDEDVFWRQADSVGFTSRGVRGLEDQGVVRIPVLRAGSLSNLPLTVTVNLVSPPNPAPLGWAIPGVEFDDSVFPQTLTWGSNDTAVKEVVVPLRDDAGADDAAKFFFSALVGPTGNRRVQGATLIFDNLSDYATLDSDGDGILNTADIDNDNDGVPDPLDKFPLDPAESADFDGDGIGDNADTDTDGDGIGNAIESALGLNSLNAGDAQGDSDGDGVSDASEIASGSNPLSNTSVPGSGFIELATLNVIASEDSRGAVIDVQRVRGSAGPLAVQLTTQNMQAIAGVDYTAVNQTLTWANGDITPRRVVIPLINNNTVNGNRTFKVRLTAGAGTTPDQVTVNETRVLILDDDFNAQGAPFAGFANVQEADLRVRESAGSAIVYVDRRGSVSGTLSVGYALVPDNATPGVDYVPRAGILTWPDGASDAKPIAISIIDDLEIEGTEGFSLQLFNLSGNGHVDFGETHIQIVDDELIRQADVVTPASLKPLYNETDGTVTLSLFRLGAGTQAATVNVAHTDREAIEGSDYSGVTQQVNWAAGERGSKQITFTVLDDAIAEPLESFEITLSSPTPGLVVDSAPIRVFIADPEDTDLTTDSDADGVPDFADLDDDNDHVNDFADAFPNDPTRSAPDSDGDGVDDNLDAFPFDPTETVDTDHDGIGDNRDTDDDNDGIADAVENAYPAILSRTNPADAALDSDGDGISNLRETRAGYRPDNASSVPGAGYLSFASTAVNALDSDGSVSVEVRRLRGDVGAVTVTLQTFDGSARSGRDYSAVNQVLTWADGDVSPRTVSIPLIQTPQRFMGLFGVRLVPSTNERILVDEMRVSIREHDLEYTGTAFAGIIRYRADGLRIPESAGQAVIQVAREGSAQGPASVDYVVVPAFPASTTQPTAGVDYVPTSGTLVWADGDQVPKSIVIPILDDATIEPTEALKVQFSNPSAGVWLLPYTPYIQIIDDEVVQLPNVVEQTTFLSYVEETEPSARVRFLRSGNGVGADTLHIGFTATGLNPVATAGQDFNATPQTLTWADGETGLRDLVIPILDDAVLDDPAAYELIPVSLTSWTGQGLLVPIDYYPIPVVLDFEDLDTTTDTDGDGTPDLFDMDADNDGVLNFNDPFPLDATETVDTDHDGIGDNRDTDDDNDGIADTIENSYPFLSRTNAADANLDYDGDGISNLREIRAGYRPDDANSVPDAGYLSFTCNYFSWEETDGPVPVEVRRLRGDVGPLSVTLQTFDGSAVAGVDYVATTQTLTWADGDVTPRTVNIPVIRTPARRQGVFGARLIPSSNERILVDEMRVLVTESDLQSSGTDFAGNIVAASFSSRVPESAGQAVVYVDRAGGDHGVVSVDYRLDPTSGRLPTPGVDYVPTSGTLVWADGDRAPKRIVVPILDDSETEFTESLVLTLSNASPNAVLSPYQANIQILDDEVARLPNVVGPTTFLSFLEETEPAARVRFVRTGNGAGQVTVQIGFTATPNPAATPGVDFDGSPQTLVWADGETGARDLLIPLIGDSTPDNAVAFEQIPISILSITGGAVYPEYYWPDPVVFDLEDQDATTDSDGDGAPNLFDVDDDNDGILDVNDAFPFDPTNTPPDVTPQTTDDSVVAPAGGTLAGINVLGNDLNLTNTPVVVAIVSQPTGGTVAVNANNTINYTARAGFFGADSFVYSVTDADGDVDSGTVTVFVDAVPIATADSAEVFVGTSVVINVLANDSGLGNGGISVTVSAPPAHGTLTVNADNTLTYRPNAGFAGSDTASYRVTDSDGDSATATLTLFADDAPIAHNDNAGETVVNTPLLGINVLQNDTGLGNGPVTITLQGTPLNARVRVNADNTLDYLPVSGFSGVDSFRYRVTDADGDFSIGLVTTNVSSASGIPGQNVNLVGLTPNDPLYVPDTGLRQQNEVQCALEPDNQLRIFCVFNDYRAVNLTGDSWIGASMSRDGGSNWFSRLTPHFNQYPAYTAPTAPPPLKGLGLGFAADPSIASVPGGMLVGFIASSRDEEGVGGLYLQRWFEQNSEVAFPWRPQIEPIVVDSGAEERFIDKDHMIFTLAPATSADDTVTVHGTLEDGTQVTREWPRGDVTFAYTVFNGPEDAEVVDFEKFDIGPLAGQDEWEVDGAAEGVSVDTAPLRSSRAVRINTVGLAGETTARIPMMPSSNTRGAQIAIEFLVNTLAEAPTGTFVIETPFANLEIHNGAIGVEGDAAHAVPIPTGEWVSLALFADPISRTFNVTVVDHGTLVDQPFSAATSTEIGIRASGAADDELFIDSLTLQVATNSDILVRQSSDYGDTWRAPTQLTSHSASASANQGVYLASQGDNMLAVWRRVDDPLNLDPAQTDAIMYATSRDRGRSWSTEALLANICPFDQTGETDRFRTITFPTAVATSTGFIVVWSDRGYAPGVSGAVECETGPARVVMTQQAADGHWSTPVPIDPIPAGGRQFGHQFMPAINVAQDQVQVAWYDSRSDESGSFTQFIDDEAAVANGDPLLLRHTLDVRSVRLVDGRPVGPSMRVTQFQQGVTPADPGTLMQLDRFYANGRLFRQGATPFLGDYMGVAAQAHRQLPDGRWVSNQFRDATNPNAREPGFFVSWTDNRDVRGDVWRDLAEPTLYTPITLAGTAADGEPDAPNESGMCVPGTVSGEDLALTRNQNVYGSMIRPGLQMSVPTPGKPISDIQRGFVVYLQNFTSQEHRYAVKILNQPPNGRASFLQLPLPPTSVPPLTQADVVVPPRSGIAKTVYLVSAGSLDADRVDIQVVEEDCTNCQSDRVVLNGGELANDFANPGLRFDAVAAEIRTPTIEAPTVTVSTPGLRFPGLRFPGLRFPGLEFPGLRFPDLQFPGLRFPGLRFPDVQNPGLRFPGLRFDAVADGTPQPVDFEDRVEVGEEALDDAGSQNAALVEAAGNRQMTEIVWPVTNEGNVVGAFDLQPFINADLSNAQSQLLVVRSYVTNTIQECNLIPQINQEVVINIANPDLTGRDADVKMFIAPGETLLVILRVFEEVTPGAPAPDPIVHIDPTDAAIAVRADACDTQQTHCDPSSNDPALRPPTAVQGAHPVDAVFARLTAAGINMTAGRPTLDTRSGRMVADISVTNRSAHPLIGQLRAVITANKAPLASDGVADNGKPYLLLLPNANSILGVGQSVTRRIEFSTSRPAPIFSTELWLKSVTPP